ASVRSDDRGLRLRLAGPALPGPQRLDRDRRPTLGRRRRATAALGDARRAERRRTGRGGSRDAVICHAYNCIFVHQRKCAGISIIRAFGLDPSIPDWHFMNDGALSAEYTLAPPGYFRFSVVRNPWDRFVSGWKYL